jgi:Holliday junction resolvase RusA-like endonuclease
MIGGIGLIVYIPPPPSLNRLWATTGRGRVRSREYRAWAQAAGWEVKRQMVGIPMLMGRFDAAVLVPISRRDTDNWLKALFDLLESVGVVANDGNLHRVNVEPMEREDCCVALTPRPDVGNVRKPVKPRWQGRTLPARPSAAQLKKTRALQSKLPF